MCGSKITYLFITRAWLAERTSSSFSDNTHIHKHGVFSEYNSAAVSHTETRTHAGAHAKVRKATRCSRRFEAFLADAHHDMAQLKGHSGCVVTHTRAGMCECVSECVRQEKTDGAVLSAREEGGVTKQ